MKAEVTNEKNGGLHEIRDTECGRVANRLNERIRLRYSLQEYGEQMQSKAKVFHFLCRRRERRRRG
jgi:hypothetical protein